MKNILVLLFLCFPFLCLAQPGQYVQFTSVISLEDSVRLEYEWWELDPVIRVQIVFDNQDVCVDSFLVTTGSSFCIVNNLESGWYEYYLYLEDGDQHIDSTEVGKIFVSGVALSISEVRQESFAGNLRVFDILGREVDVGMLQTGVCYILRFASGSVKKIVFVE